MVKGPSSLGKVGAVIQARTCSQRLPGKTLLSLPFDSSTSVLEQIVKRAERIKMVNEVIVATTNDKADDIIESVSNNLNVKCFRGDEHNVLSRFFCAAKKNSLDIVVRLTGDNPCIDCDIINSILDFHIREKNDYTTTKGYPVGLNTEIISFKALEKAVIESSTSFEREHITPYIYTNPDRFKISVERAEKEYHYPDIRLTLDTEEDYALLCTIFDYLYPQNEFFGTEEIIKLFRDKPWLRTINKNVVQKKIFDSLQQELEEAVRILDLQELKRAKELLARHLK